MMVDLIMYLLIIALIWCDIMMYKYIHNTIDDFMVDVDTDGNLSHTPVSNHGVTISIKQNG